MSQNQTRLEILKRYLIEDPDDSFVRYAIALEYMNTSDNTLAYDLLQKLIKEDPDYLPAYYMAGKTAKQLNNLTEAIQFYKTGIAVAQKQSDAHTLSELTLALETLEDN